MPSGYKQKRTGLAVYSADTIKEKNSVKLNQIVYEVRNRYFVGSRFKLETDSRVGCVNGHAHYKPGFYTIIAFYDHYILTEREDLITFLKFKESFTYPDMWMILKGTFPGLYCKDSPSKEEDDDDSTDI